jgi:hypothetical protein
MTIPFHDWRKRSVLLAPIAVALANEVVVEGADEWTDGVLVWFAGPLL